jgi:tRNA threonylcarbamoyladenosine biosynthesis protein TsaB
MRLLGLDSATRACSVAVWRDGEVEAHRFQLGERGQAELLMPMVVEVMAEANTAFDRLDGLAVTVGPGSFTGLRIGLAAARGMARAGDLPLAGVTTFEAFAAGVPERLRAGRPVIVVIDTKRADVYVQRFTAELVPADAAAALPPEAIPELLSDASTVMAGDGVHLVHDALSASGRSFDDAATAAPDAAAVAALAAGRIGAIEPGLMPEPFYLHPPAVGPPVADRSPR